MPRDGPARCTHMPLTPADPVRGLDPRDGPVLESCTSTPPAHASAYKRLTQVTPPPTNRLLNTTFCHLSAWGWCLPPRDGLACCKHMPLTSSDPVIRPGSTRWARVGELHIHSPCAHLCLQVAYSRHPSTYKPLTQHPISPSFGMEMVPATEGCIRMGSHTVHTCLSPLPTLSSGLDPRDGPVLGSCTSVTTLLQITMYSDAWNLWTNGSWWHFPRRMLQTFQQATALPNMYK